MRCTETLRSNTGAGLLVTVVWGGSVTIVIRREMAETVRIKSLQQIALSTVGRQTGFEGLLHLLTQCRWFQHFNVSTVTQ